MVFDGLRRDLEGCGGRGTMEIFHVIFVRGGDSSELGKGPFFYLDFAPQWQNVDSNVSVRCKTFDTFQNWVFQNRVPRT